VYLLLANSENWRVLHSIALLKCV